MKKTFQKIIISIWIIAIGILPLHTHAVWGMGDVNFDPSIFSQETIQTIGQVSQIVDMVQNALKTFGLDVVIYKVSQKLSQKLLNKVLNKANGGADGEDSKLFVENFGKYFQNITQQQIGQYTNSLYDSSSPFAQSIFTGITNQAGGDANAAKSLLEKFSLGDGLPDGVKWSDVAGDISLAGDAAQGWDFYGKLSQPQNTPLGAGMIAQADLSQQIRTAQETAKTELTSSGFKPNKTLNVNSFLSGIGGSSGGFGGFGSGSSSNSGANDETAKLQAEHAKAEAEYNQMNGISSGGSGESSLDKEVNKDGKITSPTKTTEDQAGQSVTESFDRLRNADTFGKIIFGTITQMITGLIQKGFSSLKSDGGTSPKPYGGIREVSNILNSSSKTWANAPQQVVDLRHELEIGVEKTKLEIAALQKTMDSIKKPLTDDSEFSTGYETFKGTVLSLEACTPGPDTGFEQRLNDYITKQLKDTQNRAGRDNDKGTKNSEALTLIRDETNQALLESKIILNDPFLNIPGTSALKSGLSGYYKMSKRFTGLINNLVIKQQVYNSLLVLQSEALAYGKQYNNNIPLILTEKKWNSTGTDKNAVYQDVSAGILANFPEYLVAAPNDPGNRSVKPLPPDDPATSDIDERDVEMMKRVLDEQWSEWEDKVPDDKKQGLYAKYIALTQDISDSSSAQKAQVIAQSTEEQYQYLKDLLSDCVAIRNHLSGGNIDPANDDAFIETLKSDSIRSTYKGPSILTAAANDFDFAKHNERISGSLSDSYGLQVPQLPTTAPEVLSQDTQSNLSCRLTNYELFYWAPKDLTGKPIGCGQGRPKFLKVAASSSYTFTSPNLIGIFAPDGDSTSGAAEEVKPNWYHTNNAEILFAVNGAGE